MFFVRNLELVSEYLDKDICIFDEENSEYFNINNSGSFIWEFIETPKKFDEIIEEISKYYSIENKNFEEEIKYFLIEGIKKNIIKSITNK